VVCAPLVELVTTGARLQDYEGREALNAIAASRDPVLRSIDLHEFNLVTILSGEFIDNFVPTRHEFDAVLALGHVKVHNDELIMVSSIN